MALLLPIAPALVLGGSLGRWLQTHNGSVDGLMPGASRCLGLGMVAWLALFLLVATLLPASTSFGDEPLAEAAPDPTLLFRVAWITAMIGSLVLCWVIAWAWIGALCAAQFIRRR